MGNWVSQEKKPRCKWLILGLEDAGKTTLTHRLFYHPERVFGKLEELYEFETSYNHYYCLVCDLPAFPDSLRTLWRNYLKEVTAIIYVIDSTSPSTYEVGKSEIEMRKFIHEENLHSLPILFLANKQDRPNALDVREITKIMNLPSLQNPHGIFPSNAITGDGVWEGVDWLMEIMQNPESYVPVYFGEPQVKSANNNCKNVE